MSDGAEVADVEMGPNGTKWDQMGPSFQSQRDVISSLTGVDNQSLFIVAFSFCLLC